MAMIIDGTLGASFNDGSLQGAAASPNVLKNRIINGAMVIDQRNAGASVTPGSGNITLDRFGAGMSQASKFSVQQNAGSVTPPVGFTNYLGVTSLSAYTVGASEGFYIYQIIEGYNIADFNWGSANASTVTLSFWVRSSLTGTFGGVLRGSNANRTYPFTYTISAANTWEKKSVTIPGDTTGTWLTTNGAGVAVRFSVGSGASDSGTPGAWVTGGFTSATGSVSVVGTNGATWYVTGVQLEQNTSATPFERRLYGQELANCQRYYWRISGIATGNGYPPIGSGVNLSSTSSRLYIKNPVSMRASATTSFAGTVSAFDGGSGELSAIATTFSGPDSIMIDVTISGGLTAGRGVVLYPGNATTNYFDASAEL